MIENLSSSQSEKTAIYVAADPEAQRYRICPHPHRGHLSIGSEKKPLTVARKAEENASITD